MAKLLIVDDENDVREFAANFFRKRKIEVITATSGEEALEKVGSDNPDLILLDIQMSGMNGLETLEEIRKRGSGVKVIMVTGKGPEENSTSERSKELGALDYIHKPLRLDELEKTVMNILKGI